MKHLFWLFLVIQSVTVAIAQTNEQTVKLIGIVDGFGIKLAILKVQKTGSGSPSEFFLKEGQVQNDVEVLAIDSGKETVNVNVAGKTSSLELEEPDGTRSTNTLASGPSIHLVSIDLQPAISMYADFKKRTILQHPELGDPKLSVQAHPQSEAEVAAIFEKMFSERNIATIPDGDKFVMIVPFAFTNSVIPHADAVGATNALIPSLSVNFVGVPVNMVLDVHADFLGRKIVNARDAPQIPTVTFVQTTPLSKAELCYAFETLIAWRNLRFVPDGRDLKWERIHEPN